MSKITYDKIPDFGNPKKSERRKRIETMMAWVGMTDVKDLEPEDRQRFLDIIDGKIKNKKAQENNQNILILIHPDAVFERGTGVAKEYLKRLKESVSKFDKVFVHLFFTDNYISNISDSEIIETVSGIIELLKALPNTSITYDTSAGKESFENNIIPYLLDNIDKSFNIFFSGGNQDLCLRDSYFNYCNMQELLVNKDPSWKHNVFLYNPLVYRYEREKIPAGLGIAYPAKTAPLKFNPFKENIWNFDRYKGKTGVEEDTWLHGIVREDVKSARKGESFLKVSVLKKWLRNKGFKKEALSLNRLYKLKKYAISKAEIDRLKKWFSGEKSNLSFDELFGGKFRTVIPFTTQEQNKLIEIISFLKKKGWEPSGGNNFFNIKKVKQKLRKLDDGEEYEKEVENADLKISKKEKRIIPSGPKKGEEIVSMVTSTISKVLANKKNNAPTWMQEWWQEKQSEYVKDYNWKQIESVFKDGSLKSEHSIVISRDPIDVLRMSDHRNIRSCHSEGDSYFSCAISESKGNGLIAYLVETNELDRLLTPKDPWGWDPETGKGPEKFDISELDDKEIFADPMRGVKGIVPKSRIRLRKYVNTEMGYEFAVPENRTYGPHPPGFKDLVRSWAWEQQKHLFEFGADELSLFDLKMHGGSYRDSSDGEILTSFFKEGGIDTNINLYGDAETVSEDESNLLDMWQEEIDETMERANMELKHLSFYAEVDEFDEGHPYVSVSTYLNCEIPLSGWDEIYYEDGFAKTKSGFEDIPVTWQAEGRRFFLDLIDHPEASSIDEVNVLIEERVLTFSLNFECDDCFNPDDVDNYYEYIKTEIDGSYDVYIETIRKKLISEGYIEEIEFDRAAERLESINLNYFDILGTDEDDYDGEIWINSKPNASGISLEIPSVITNEISGSNISKILNAKKSSRISAIQKYLLKDEKLIAIDIINKIKKESYELAKKQLHFSFYKEDELEQFSSEILDNLEIYAVIFNNVLNDLNIKLTLSVKDSDEQILFIEKFAATLDKNFHKIIGPITDSLNNKIQNALTEASSVAQSFYDGNLAKPIIQNLKGFATPDVRRLALWIEKNWNNFSNAEKEVAYYQYLIPTERDGDYVHTDSLDSPKFWNNFMQKREDTDISYWWEGPSMKDIVLDTEIAEPAAESIEQKNSPDDKVESLSFWLVYNGFKKEADSLQEYLGKNVGYKVVGFKNGKVYSLQNPDKYYSLRIGEIEEDPSGFFLGTTKEFVTDYYSGLTEDQDILLEYSYDSDDLLFGDPKETGEVKVGKAKLLSAYVLDNDSLGDDRLNRMKFADDYSDYRLSNIFNSGIIPKNYLKRLPYKEGELAKIYRGVPPGVDTIRPGDWVSLDYSHAAEHDRGGGVISIEVSPEDIVWSGTDLNEWFYTPKSIKVATDRFKNE